MTIIMLQIIYFKLFLNLAPQTLSGVTTPSSAHRGDHLPSGPFPPALAVIFH